MSRSDPCVNICVHDRVTELCIGCGRTVDEIRDWRRLSAEARATIASQLKQRLATMTARQTRKGRGRNARAQAR